MHALVVFPQHDTIRIDLPATTLQCAGEKSILLQAVSPEGPGVLLRLRYRDSLVSDSFPVVSPDDAATVPASVVAVRYFNHDTPHAVLLDSGVVRVQRRRSMVSARVVGSALENAIRTPTRIEFKDVPLRGDTVSCGSAP